MNCQRIFPLFCLMFLICIQSCLAGNYEMVPNNKMSITGRVTDIEPSNNNFTWVFGDDSLAQKVGVMSNNEGTYQISYVPFKTQLIFYVDRSIGLLKIESLGGPLKTPDGDEQQDTAVAVVNGNTMIIKIVRDIKLDYTSYVAKTWPLRLVKAGSWIKIIFK